MKHRSIVVGQNPTGTVIDEGARKYDTNGTLSIDTAYGFLVVDSDCKIRCPKARRVIPSDFFALLLKRLSKMNDL
eukprot:CAMPEP_0181053898 /NCGR_PEP_ID=MMETSP1070-20121207/18381_1 /TAXON_ID=265543 /ORGANISM="Minutocellus polymorphus, Strain NH13" /LENGTH=74 /DNA_ID=CAMNT_0023133113 /DNA_START=1905 /DNA_END=2129 /DNA_ORIENTATION=-